MVSRVRIADGSPHADVAELADAIDLGSISREWGFKSSHPHQKETISNLIVSFFVS